MAPLAYGATRPFAGIAFLVLSAWALSGLDASGKWVMGVGVSLLMLCWVRYVVHLLLVLGLVLPSRGREVLRSVRPGAQLLRGSVMLLATLSFFNTLRYLPQAEATAINFLAPLCDPFEVRTPPSFANLPSLRCGCIRIRRYRSQSGATCVCTQGRDRRPRDSYVNRRSHPRHRSAAHCAASASSGFASG